jgi:hypothetical protein
VSLVAEDDNAIVWRNAEGVIRKDDYDHTVWLGPKKRAERRKQSLRPQMRAADALVRLIGDLPANDGKLEERPSSLRPINMAPTSASVDQPPCILLQIEGRGRAVAEAGTLRFVLNHENSSAVLSVEVLGPSRRLIGAYALTRVPANQWMQLEDLKGNLARVWLRITARGTELRLGQGPMDSQILRPLRY